MKAFVRKNFALVVTLVFLLFAAGLIYYLWSSSSSTLDTLDRTEDVNSQDVVIASKQLIENIEGYSNLPVEARGSVVGVLQNTCESSNQVAAKVDSKEVEGKLIVINASCAGNQSTTYVFAKTETGWQKISEPNGKVSCDNASKYAVPADWSITEACTQIGL